LPFKTTLRLFYQWKVLGMSVNAMLYGNHARDTHMQQTTCLYEFSPSDTVCFIAWAEKVMRVSLMRALHIPRGKRI